MFNPAGYTLERPLNAWVMILLLLLGGLWALMTLGRLEDPAFTIKQAMVITPYPGATAQEVEEEVTEHLESAIQQLPQLRHLTSRSLPGRSEITLEIDDRYRGKDMPQIWDELRRRVQDAQQEMPPGSQPSQVIDDFGDVFGIFYAVMAEDFSDQEIRDLERFLRRELLTVPGVGKVTSAGQPTETIYLDVSHEQLTRLRLPVDQLLSIIQSENSVVDAGRSRIDDQRLRLVVRPGMDSVATLEAIRVGLPGATEQLQLGDLAEIHRLPTEHPRHLIRHNGREAFTLAIAGVADTNIVEVGQAVEAHLAHLEPRIPLGVEIQPIYEQHRVVDTAVKSFMVNLALSVSIVIAVLCLFMGWRVGLVVGSTLLLTVFGTLFFMRLLNIDMERVSLGAMIIAMGMLVDNAIVVAEGMLINLQRKLRPDQAAQEAVSRTQFPLLGATLIGIMAFAGIGLSPDQTGEFLFSLFQVISISLLLSWLLAITITPLLGYYLLQVPASGQDSDPYASRVYRLYSQLLNLSLNYRKVTLGILMLLTLSSFLAFGWLRMAFFPNSNTPLFYIHYQLPQGSDIRATSRDLAEMEQILLQKEEVVSVTSFVGQGASRFMLTYEPTQPHPGYGQLLVRVQDLDAIDPMIEELREKLVYPQGQLRFERIMFGPGVEAQIEARLSGSDLARLRELGSEITQQMQEQPELVDVRHDWKEKEKVLSPRFHEQRGRHAGIRREDLAQALKFSTEGVVAGSYREGVERLPLVARLTASDRGDLGRLLERKIWSPMEAAYIPMDQVVEGFELIPEEASIHRRNRLRTLTVQAEPAPGYTTDEAFQAISRQLADYPLPDGYRLEWGGEFEAATDAQKALASQLPISFLVMLVISLLLFGRWRQPLLIWLVVPMSAVGVVFGLLATGLPFGFMALLGFLSLSGMLMKNAIVLVDEIDHQLTQINSRREALLQASSSRLRPVILAAVTTILGMLPLLFDAFFASMAVTIMAGLAFATLLTLIAVPVLYDLFISGKATDERHAGKQLATETTT
ncbi:Multidrug efflux pump subunit AcrB [Marinospirillum celere]|uniref:Multidrug efflux pump subunit AcrB n=1 Tax=Marinospirillum celere TaxID=1122252 RepID=A0A1I1GBD6_9GAMM|nr:efflux RND transporter permease subunit [Marinospirillum celere]SFC06663.1 Multidrug efflux pump subunit AcrB [Marinospirillum celere]